jgi:hypothetical protein
MNVCARCHEVAEKGKQQGRNFVCQSCLTKESLARSSVDRREVLPDGSVKYHCGNIVAIPEVLGGVRPDVL